MSEWPVPAAPGITLRAMRWWDIETLLPLERSLFGPGAWTAESFWAELAHPESRWYVVAQDRLGQLLGYAGLLCSGPEADVQTIAVAGAAQGQGLGGVLLDALLAQARRLKATSVLLEVRAGNGPAIALYRRRGFERIAIRRRYYQPEGADAWVMRLRPLAQG